MAVRYWLGAAIAVPEVYTISIAGTWAASETVYLELNGKRLTLTVGSTATIDQIGADLADMINGESANGDETRSALGTAVGEWALVTAAYDSSADNLTLTGQSDGRPIGTLTVGETSSSGTFTVDNSGDPTTAGTGPHHFDDVDNWSGDTVPVDSDTIVFDHQASAALKYALTPASLTPASLKVTNGFRYSIGLPAVNSTNASLLFDEFLATYLTIDGATAATIDGSGASHIKIDFGNTASAITVENTGTSPQTQVPAVLVKANHSSSTLTVVAGSVGLNFEQGVSGQVSTIYMGGASAVPRLQVGDSVTIATVYQSSGEVRNRSTPTTIQVAGGTYYHFGSGITTINLDHATLVLMSTGGCTTINSDGGIIDATQSPSARTFTNTNIYAGTQIKDPRGSLTFTNGLDLYCKPTQVTLDLPPRKTYTISAI